MSLTISRVLYLVIIYLLIASPLSSSNLPGNTTGSRIVSCLVLLRMGFTCALPVTVQAVVSYTAFPPLPLKTVAVYFCCTGLGVTSTGRYPASCPVKPGLSSPAAFRHLQLRLLVLLALVTISHLILKYNSYFAIPSSTIRSCPSAAVVANVSHRSF